MILDWYPWYPFDYRSDTLRLTLAEDGAYRRLIDEYMIRRGPLPDDDISLARILGVGLGDWLNVARAVRSFFQPKGEFLHHRRCAQELRAQDLRATRYREAGLKSAFVRAIKNNNLAKDPGLKSNTLHYIGPFPLSSTEQGAEKGPSKSKRPSDMSLAEIDEAIARRKTPGKQE